MDDNCVNCGCENNHLAGFGMAVGNDWLCENCAPFIMWNPVMSDDEIESILQL